MSVSFFRMNTINMARNKVFKPKVNRNTVFGYATYISVFLSRLNFSRQNFRFFFPVASAKERMKFAAIRMEFL